MSVSVQPIEFSVPLTPLLIAVVKEVQRLRKAEDREGVELIIESVQPLLRRTICEHRGLS